MKNKKILGIFVIGICILSISSLAAQTSTSSKISSGGLGGNTSTTWGTNQNTQQQNTQQNMINNFVMAVIGGLLRHPDPTIRIQAIQSISMGMISGEGTDNSSTTGSIGSIFGVNTQGTGTTNGSNTSTGVGGAIFIPDLFILLNDPNPEVRDMASIGLDAIFNTDTTLIRLVNDEDPIVRKYAVQIFAKRQLAGTENQISSNTSSNTQNLTDVKSFLAVRTLLVRLKHEDNEEVKKAIQDALDKYINQDANGISGR